MKTAMNKTKEQQSVYAQWLESCLNADIPAISTDTAARLMAVLHEYGNYSHSGLVNLK